MRVSILTESSQSVLGDVPIIYLIRNTVNGKVYVGKTVRSLATRWSQHRHAARKSSAYPIHRAIRKYGVNAFQVSVLAQTDCTCPELLNDLERFCIEKKQSHVGRHGYNLTSGGEGVPLTPEARLRATRVRMERRKRWLRSEKYQYGQMLKGLVQRMSTKERQETAEWIRLAETKISALSDTEPYTGLG